MSEDYLISLGYLPSYKPPPDRSPQKQWHVLSEFCYQSAEYFDNTDFDIFITNYLVMSDAYTYIKWWLLGLMVGFCSQSVW